MKCETNFWTQIISFQQCLLPAFFCKVKIEKLSKCLIFHFPGIDESYKRTTRFGLNNLFMQNNICGNYMPFASHCSLEDINIYCWGPILLTTKTLSSIQSPINFRYGQIWTGGTNSRLYRTYLHQVFIFFPLRLQKIWTQGSLLSS